MDTTLIAILNLDKDVLTFCVSGRSDMLARRKPENIQADDATSCPD